MTQQWHLARKDSVGQARPLVPTGSEPPTFPACFGAFQALLLTTHMKHRVWWLGLLILILVAGVCVVLVRTGVVDLKGLSHGNPQESENDSAGTNPAGKNPKRSRTATTTRLVSPVPGKVVLPELTDEEVARFLADSHRNPDALLAVFRLKGDLALLREAAAAFPDHAMIQLELALSGKTPDEKQQALESFRKLAPDNAMGDYLAALFHFEQGQQQEALDALARVESHPGFGDQSPTRIQSAEDVFRSAGYGLLEAKSAALLGQPRTQTLALFKLSGNLATLCQQYTAAGEAEAAQAVLQMGLSISRRLRGESRLLIDDIVGITIETRLLGQVPEDATVPGGGQTAADRFDALTAEKQEISDLANQCLPVLEAMSQSEVIAYLKHLSHDGELKALRWLQQNRQ